MDLWDAIVELQANHGPALSAAFLALAHSDVSSSTPVDPTTRRGTVDIAVAVDELRGAASLRLGRGLVGARPFVLHREGDGFVLDLTLAAPRFDLPDELRPAEVIDGRLRPAASPDPVRLVLPDVVLRVDASRADQPEHYRFVLGAGDDLVVARVEPGAVLLGDTGFGVELAEVVFDASATASPPLPARADGAPALQLEREWTGMAVPTATLHFPAAGSELVPEPVALQVAVGDDGSVRASGHASSPLTTKPGIDLTVVVDDPFAGSLLGLVPTYARAIVNFPATSTVPGIGAPVATDGLVVTATWTRLATPPGGAPPTVSLDVVAAANGPDGLVHLGTDSDPGKVAVTAAALADVVLNDLFDGDGYVGLAALVGAGTLLGETQVDRGSFVLTRAEVKAGVGPTSPRPEIVLDYDAAIHLRGINAGAFRLEMDETPFALAYRGVRIRPGGALGVELDYGDATVEVRSTGSWRVEPRSLPLRIPAVRFGQGSLWTEFDLDVAVELGPITVDRATLRVGLSSDGFGAPELRGLGIHLDVPEALRVAGQARFAGSGLAASLAGYAGPGGKGFAVTAQLVMGGAYAGLAVAVTFPGPIPLANSGFGLFGAEGGFAIGARPQLAEGDPVVAALEWKPDLATEHFWTGDPSSFTFWLGLMIGTLPDAGFSLNAHARLAAAVPDLLFRLSLDADLLAPPGTLAAAESGPVGGPGPTFLGVLQAGPPGVDVGLRGELDLRPLLEVTVPVGAHFPSNGPAWFIRVGTDGDPSRPPGPVRVSFLPDLLGIYAAAFLMFEGAGIANVGQQLLDITLPPTSSFTVAFGAGFDLKYGSPPFWLEVSGAMVAEVASHPFLVAASARIAGSLHLGPFSVGADAAIDLLVGTVDGEDVLWAQAHVCGSIDLWLTDIEGCVTINLGNKRQPVITPPNPLVALSLMRPDGQVTPLGPDGRAAVVRSADEVPTVWPDTIPSLAFATMPATVWSAPAPPPAPPTPTTVVTTGNVHIGPNTADGRTGSNDLLFAYRLAALDLVDDDGVAFQPVDDDGNPTDLLATVQLGKGTDGGRELAVNTWSSSIWARALEDGGVSTGNPAKVAVDQCDPVIRPRPGWALGVEASGALGSWLAPPEQVHVDPLRSVVSARVEVRSGGDHVLEPSDVWSPPPNGAGRVVPPHVERTPAGATIAAPAAARSFAGSLWLGSADWPGLAPGRLAHDGYNAVIRPIPALHDPSDQPAQLCLLVERGLVDVGLPEVTTQGNAWEPTLDIVEWLEGFVAVTYVSGRDVPVGQIDVVWGNGMVALLGVGGVTVVAQHEAERQTDEARARHHAVEALAAAPPLAGPGNLFAPGHEYSVVAELTAIQVQPVDDRGALPFDSPDGTVRRFRVASEAPVPAPVTDWEIFNDESIFCPEYLRRYLHPTDPVTPADLTRFVFLADDVMVSFWAAHTEQLAARYGYRLHVRIRQVDAHPTGVTINATDVDLTTITPLLGGAPSFAVDVQLRDLLDEHNRAREQAGIVRCHVPAAGATKVIPAVLGCDGHYELRIVAARDGVEHVERVERVVHTTTFATSLYRDPEDLLWELGLFDAAVAPAATRTTHRCWRDVVRVPARAGEVAVERVPTVAGTQRGDHELDRALAALGIAPWPRGTNPCRWNLWVPPANVGDPWVLHGVLLEAPEPILRPGRVDIRDAHVVGALLDAVVSDDAGCRVLLLGAPAPPTGALAVTVVESAGGHAGQPVTTTQWNAVADVPAQPGFAHEVTVR